MKKFVKQDYVSYIGLLGLACLMGMVVVWLMQMKFGIAPMVLAGVGALAALAYIVLDFQNVKRTLTTRSVKYGANTSLMILIVLAILVLVEVISIRHNKVVDLTQNKRYTLSEQTEKILKALTKEISITAFFTLENGQRLVMEDLLSRYRKLSSKITFEIVDPVKNPGRTKQYEITMDGTTVLQTGDKQEKIYETSEETLTNALIKVTREGKKVVYFLKGHGERDIDDSGQNGYSQVKQALEKLNYEVRYLLLMQVTAVPEDASQVIIAGPEKDLLPNEIEALTAYIQKGGHVLLCVDPDMASGLKPFLKNYGIVLGDNTIIDPNPLGQLMGAGPGMPIASSYADHPITQKFNIASMYPLARSVELMTPLPDGVMGQILVKSGSESWGETSAEELHSGKVRFTEGQDQKGPLGLAAVVTVAVKTPEDTTAPGEAPAKTPEGRLVVFGDSDFAMNAYIGMSGNGDFFLNTVNWLAEEEDLVAISAKNPEMVPLMLTAAQGNFAFLLTVVFLPLLVAFTGITVFLNRRKMTR